MSPVVYFGDISPERVLARPNRSVSASTLLLVVAGLGVAMFAVASFSWMQGNLFAPWFALLHLLLVASALAVVWRRSDASDEVECVDDRVRVTLRRGARVWTREFHPLWVRVVEEPAPQWHGARRVYLRSHGRSLELGLFLSDEQRLALAQHLRALLEEARRRMLDRSSSPVVTSSSQP